ncbi:MAG: alpha/beta hydrolase [Sphingomonadaceae bacterium]|nr:alpha/beta hydrolase [Sphingomonadaceae bacterium]
MANFVLIHGAWGGAWSWGSIPERLMRAGHNVLCPDLPGMGDRVGEKHGGITLTDHIEDVVGLIGECSMERFVLVGHSYGGMVITGIASRLGQRIDAICYVDAFLPKDGESLWDVVGEYEHKSYIDTQKRTPGLCAPIFGEEMLEKPGISRQPLLTLTEAVDRGAAWDHIPNKSYIFASGWKPSPFPRFAEEVRNYPAWQYHDFPCTHGVMTDMPDELEAVLLGLV